MCARVTVLDSRKAQDQKNKKSPYINKCTKCACMHARVCACVSVQAEVFRGKLKGGLRFVWKGAVDGVMVRFCR